MLKKREHGGGAVPSRNPFAACGKRRKLPFLQAANGLRDAPAYCFPVGIRDRTPWVIINIMDDLKAANLAGGDLLKTPDFIKGPGCLIQT